MIWSLEFRRVLFRSTPDGAVGSGAASCAGKVGAREIATNCSMRMPRAIDFKSWSPEWTIAAVLVRSQDYWLAHSPQDPFHSSFAYPPYASIARDKGP